jgi:hypothetical protein
LPTTERTFTRRYDTRLLGPLAQLVEQGTLNPKVEGSNPSRPIERLTRIAGLGDRMRRDLLVLR